MSTEERFRADPLPGWTPPDPFRWRPHAEVALSREAQRRVIDKMAAVDAARRRAAVDSITAVIG